MLLYGNPFLIKIDTLGVKKTWGKRTWFQREFNGQIMGLNQETRIMGQDKGVANPFR